MTIAAEQEEAIARTLDEIAHERERQIAIVQRGGEGYSPQHDDAHNRGELARAAAFYAIAAAAMQLPVSDPHRAVLEHCAGLLLPPSWPAKWHEPRRALVMAGALIVADIERLDRAAAEDVDGRVAPGHDEKN